MRVLTSFINKKSYNHNSMMMNMMMDSTTTLLSSSLSSSSTSFILNDINAWSVAGSTLESSDVASSLFGSSLLPYLVLLYFLSRDITKTPKITNFGFQFLLVFVFATIPAGIYAKYQYHDILANIDWLHGSAESFLSITNLLIILGLRLTRLQPKNDDINTSSTSSVTYNDAGLIFLSILSMLSISSNGFLLNDSIPSFLHIDNEPSNALSIPTWMVHSSSLLEWLTAMKLIWEHAETSGNPRWKGMAIAMIPSNVSGLCAVTFHFFYNNQILLWLVSIQALTTVIGNSTMAFGAYRVWFYEKNNIVKKGELLPLEKTDKEYVTELLTTSFVTAILLKYGSLLAHIEPSTESAAAIIVGATSFNIMKWVQRSLKKEDIITISTDINANSGQWP